jgi:dihydrofolate reductase
MQLSLDGYVADSGGGVDWIFPQFDDELMRFTVEALSEGDTVLMGKENYLEQAAHWPTAEDDFAPVVNGHQKIVFSSTLDSVDWQNSRLATGTPREEIAALRSRPGGSIGVSGGARFARWLLDDRLIDELRLTIHPVVLGAGIALFTHLHKLTLVNSRAFPAGAIVNTYLPA